MLDVVLGFKLANNLFGQNRDNTIRNRLGACVCVCVYVCVWKSAQSCLKAVWKSEFLCCRSITEISIHILKLDKDNSHFYLPSFLQLKNLFYHYTYSVRKKSTIVMSWLGCSLWLLLLCVLPPLDPDAGKDWRQKEKGMTEDEMVGFHHQLDGREFEQAPGVGDR